MKVHQVSKVKSDMTRFVPCTVRSVTLRFPHGRELLETTKEADLRSGADGRRDRFSVSESVEKSLYLRLFRAIIVI